MVPKRHSSGPPMGSEIPKLSGTQVARNKLINVYVLSHISQQNDRPNASAKILQAAVQIVVLSESKSKPYTATAFFFTSSLLLTAGFAVPSNADTIFGLPFC